MYLIIVSTESLFFLMLEVWAWVGKAVGGVRGGSVSRNMIIQSILLIICQLYIGTRTLFAKFCLAYRLVQHGIVCEC
jgi:hypothetical protein